jgi:Flp pilus assembly protein protease CpaA
MSNASLRTADHTTHLKIVVVSLIASVVVMVVCITARPVPDSVATARAQIIEPVVKAGKPVAVSHSGVTVIR